MHFSFKIISLVPLICSTLLMPGASRPLRHLCLKKIVEDGIPYQGTSAEHVVRYNLQELEAERMGLQQYINVSYLQPELYDREGPVQEYLEARQTTAEEIDRRAQANYQVIDDLIFKGIWSHRSSLYKTALAHICRIYTDPYTCVTCCRASNFCLSTLCLWGMLQSLAKDPLDFFKDNSIPARASCCMLAFMANIYAHEYIIVKKIIEHYDTERPQQLIKRFCCSPTWQRNLSQTPQSMIMEDFDVDASNEHEKLD